MSESDSIDGRDGDRPSDRDFSFYKRYRLIIGVTYLFLISVTFGYFVYDVRQAASKEEAIITDRVRAHILILDALASGVTSRMSDLAEYGGKVGQNSAEEIPQAGYVFSLAGEGNGNAVGLLSGFDRLFRQLPMVERLIFFGEDQQIAALPAGAEDQEGLAAFAEGAAQDIRDKLDRGNIRKPVWLPRAEIGQSDNLMAVMPIQSSESASASGLVLLEISGSYLDQVNGDLSYGLGRTVILDQNGDQISGRAGLDWMKLQHLAPRQMHIHDGSLVYWQEMEAAPWTVLYQADRSDLLIQMSWQAAPKVGLLLLASTILMLVANHLTRHEFVDPATRLVTHIHQGGESEREILSGLPPAWIPWFGEVTRIFRDNADLARVRQELQLAREMQASILPTEPIVQDGMEITGYMEPAKEIGGDFYDYFQIDPHRYGVVIADVSGKGVPAGLFMMVSRTLLKATLLADVSPGDCLRRVNDLLEEQNDMSAFVTVFLGVLDCRSRTMTYANGGHNPPYIRRANGQVEQIPSFGDLVLGMMPDMDYAQAELQFQQGDSLFLYTDGLTEAFNPDQEEYGEARMETCLADARDIHAAALNQACVTSVKAFAGEAEQSDDITCLAVHFGGEGA